MAGETGGAVRRAAAPVEPGQPVDVVVARRQVRTGPLHTRPIDELDDKPGLEARLPLLILLGLGLLVAVQVFLAL